jgi:dUTP pyrophosphatase
MRTITQLVKVKSVHPDAFVPTFASPGAACFDLRAIDVDNSTRHPNDQNAKIYRTGLKFEIPPGFCMKIYSRSGHGFKYALRLSNSVGIIDSDYRGEVMIALRGDGRDYVVEEGERIAQAKIEPLAQYVLVEAFDLSETERGEGGFGSTGKVSLQ